MKTYLDKLKERHAEELAKAEKDNVMQLRVTAIMGLGEANWSPGFAHPLPGCDCFVVYDVETLQDALELAEKFNVLNIVRYKDSCLSFKPEVALTEKQEKAISEGRATVESVGPWVYYVEDKNTLRFYIWVDKVGSDRDYLVEVRVNVLNDPLTYRVTYREKDHKGHATGPVKTRLVNNSGHFTRSSSFWTPHDVPSNYRLY